MPDDLPSPTATWYARKAIEDCLYAAEVAHTGRIHTAYAVLDALRSMPVEQRMEAMGMERVVPASGSGLMNMLFHVAWEEAADATG